MATDYWDGDGWLKRNRADIGNVDLAADIIDKMHPKPQRVLEIGCSQGWRLKKLQRLYGCHIFGIDPSKAAIEEAGDPKIFQVGRSTRIPLNDITCDLVILGFCMWAIPPSEWLQTVAETDRVLENNGLLLIHDYLSPRPFQRNYLWSQDGAKPEKVATYYMDWEKMWTAHPGYKKIAELWQADHKDKNGCVTVLRKDFISTIPLVEAIDD